MKKTLLLASALLLSVTSVNEDAYTLSRIRNMFNRNKDQNQLDVGAIINSLNEVRNAFQHISTQIDNYTLKNFSGDDAVSALLPYRIFTKTTSVFLEWVYTLSKDILTGYNNLKKANVSAEKAKSQRASDSAESRQTASKDKIQNAINSLLDVGIEALTVDVKTSATVLIKVITNIDHSDANRDTLTKDITSLRTKCATLRGQLRPFVNALKNIATDNDFSADEKKIELIADTISLIVDIVEELESYFKSEDQASEEDWANILEKCGIDNRGNSRTRSQGQTRWRDRYEEDDLPENVYDRYDRRDDDRVRERADVDDRRDRDYEERMDRRRRIDSLDVDERRYDDERYRNRDRDREMDNEYGDYDERSSTTGRYSQNKVPSSRRGRQLERSPRAITSGGR